MPAQHHSRSIYSYSTTRGQTANVERKSRVDSDCHPDEPRRKHAIRCTHGANPDTRRLTFRGLDAGFAAPAPLPPPAVPEAAAAADPIPMFLPATAPDLGPTPKALAGGASPAGCSPSPRCRRRRPRRSSRRRRRPPPSWPWGSCSGWCLRRGACGDAWSGEAGSG